LLALLFHVSILRHPTLRGDLSEALLRSLLCIAPLLPPEQPKPTGGRPRIADRVALTGITFVLKSGIPNCCPKSWAA
jgi:hypothetical protein